MIMSAPISGSPVDRRRHRGERRQGERRSRSDVIMRGTLTPKACTSAGLGRRAQMEAELGLSITNQVPMRPRPRRTDPPAR